MIMINHDLARANNYHIMADIRKSLFMLPVIAYGRNIPKEDMDNRNATGIDDFLVAPFPDNEIRNKMIRWSRRASVNPVIMQNMNNIAAMADSPSTTGSVQAGIKPAPISAGKPVPIGGGGKPAPPPLTFLSNGNPILARMAPRTGPASTFMKPPAYPNATFQSIPDGGDEKKEKETASLNSKLDLLMQQLVDVKTSTNQANLELQQRLEKQEQLYQQQQYQQPLYQQYQQPQHQYQQPLYQQYQQPQQQYQQPQQQMMQGQQGQQDWGVQGAQSNNSFSRSINNTPNPSYKVEGREFDYF